MNNYIPNYNDVIEKILKIDDTNPGVFFLVYTLLEDLRDEMLDMKTSSKDALTSGVIDICSKKINRRIEYLHNVYADQFKRAKIDE